MPGVASKVLGNTAAAPRVKLRPLGSSLEEPGSTEYLGAGRKVPGNTPPTPQVNSQPALRLAEEALEGFYASSPLCNSALKKKERKKPLE